MELNRHDMEFLVSPALHTALRVTFLSVALRDKQCFNLPFAVCACVCGLSTSGQVLMACFAGGCKAV